MQRRTLFTQLKAPFHVLIFSITAFLPFVCKAQLLEIGDCFAGKEICEREARLHPIFRDIDQMALFMLVQPSSIETEEGALPDVIKPERLREQIKEQMIKRFSPFLEDKDKSPTVYVASKASDPIFEDKGTLGIFVRLNIVRYSEKGVSPVGYLQISYYRPKKNRFASIGMETIVQQFSFELPPEKLKAIVDSTINSIGIFRTGAADQ